MDNERPDFRRVPGTGPAPPVAVGPSPSGLSPDTWYDTPARTPPDEIARASGEVARDPLVRAMIDGFPLPVVLVDRNRQIVACNERAVDAFGAASADQVVGRRPGEALDCVHAADMAAGCGTSQFCAECGAGQALRSARESLDVVSRECRIMARGEGGDVAYDFRVHAAPLKVGGVQLTLFSIQDIADEKRRHALERIFFHDVLNTANAIHGITHLLGGAERIAEFDELKGMLRSSSTQLVHEINAQRDLLSAERNELAVALRHVPAHEVLESVRLLYAASPLCDGRALEVAPVSPAIVAHTDPVQAARCLGNLVKNALEAAGTGDTVSVRAEAAGRVVRLHVHNPGVMPDNVQLQMFQRSFSTKATRGRGIGTYSVKLLVEHYLEGRVSFLSNPEQGTIFTLELPAEEGPGDAPRRLPPQA